MPIHPSADVAPTARVHPDAVIGPGCVVGDYCVVESDVVLGARCRLEPYVFVKRWTTMGDDNRVSAGACLGTDPFDKAFTGERSYLRIGVGNTIREHFTISRGTQPESETVVGDGNYIMGSGHIAHNTRVGNGCTIASCVLIAGHCVVEDQVFISGGVGVHQFTRVGRLAMIGGNIRVNQDVPPYFIYSKFEIEPSGLNRVGLRRAGLSQADTDALKRAYKILYRSNLKLAEALERIEAEAPTEHTRHLVAFIRQCKRGIARPTRRGEFRAPYGSLE
jgi:UDP-N-acetylglucosamine acyltransferase